MTSNLENAALVRRPIARLATAGLLVAAAGATVLDTGCGWTLRPRLSSSRCQMQIRLVSDPAMAPLTIFADRYLLLAPFGWEIIGCGEPSSVAARDIWERRVQQTLDEICAPASTAPLEMRMRWCSGGAWCKVPGSSTCSNSGAVPPEMCTPTPSTPPIPDCTVMPPPPGPRIQVMPNPVPFAGDTTIGTMRGRLVTVANAGGGTLTVGMARVVTTDPMSLGNFSIPTTTCGPTTPLTGAATCTLTVRFQPQSPPGVKQGQLEIPYNDGMDRVENVPISGTAVAGMLDAAGCTSDPATAGGPRRLCFGSGMQRSFTLTATGAPVPVRLALPAGYTQVAPATNPFTVTPGTPFTVTLRGTTMPVTAGFLMINRDDGGLPIRLELTSSCPVPPGCS